MKFDYLRVRNFLSFPDKEVELSDLGGYNTIVGPNNSGKTNIFRAFSFVGDILTRAAMDFRPFHGMGRLERGFDVKVGIHLDEDEAQAVANFLFCSIIASNPYRPVAGEGTDRVREVTALITRAHKPFFKSLFEKQLEIHIASVGSQLYPPRIWLRIVDGDSGLLLLDANSFVTSRIPQQIYAASTFADLLMERIREKSAQTVAFLKGEVSETPQITSSDFILTVDGITEWLSSKSHPNPMKIDVMGFNFTQFEGGFGSGEETSKALLYFLEERGVIPPEINLKDPCLQDR